MVYAGKSLAEIAGYDSYQIANIVCRKRDKFGQLIRKSGFPEGVEVDARGMRIITNPVPFEAAYKKTRRRLGVDKNKINEEWERFKKDNPKMGRGGIN